MTGRDIALFRHIQKYGFAEAEEVRRLFWNGEETKNHHRRLRKLSDKGWLAKIKGDAGVTLGFRLTSRTASWLAEVGLEKSGPTPFLPRYRTSFHHDRLLKQVRQILETSPAISEYQGEPEVRRLLAREHGHQEKRDEGYKVPDSLFSLEKPNGEHLKVALELELTFKAPKRYAKLARRIAEKAKFDVLFFIVPSPEHLWRLDKIWKGVVQNDPLVYLWSTGHSVYFVSLDELLERKLDANFHGEGKSFTLASLPQREELAMTPK